MQTKYKRILLKLSGEVLAGEKGTGIDFDTAQSICSVVKEAVSMGTQVAIVIGGGNFWRGRSSGSMDRVRADSIGMLATCMNSLALCDTLEQMGVGAKVLSALEMNKICEYFTKDKAVKYLEKGKVVIFACGTGNPFFSTDTGAALRAAEIEAEIIFKATNVEGVYNKDPRTNPDAVKYDEVSFDEVLQKDLKVMDSAAASLCRDNGIKLLVFSLKNPENIIKALAGETVGTVVS